MTTLTDRYIAAVARAMPEDSRDDIAEELRASIGDQLDARVAQGETETDAERAILVDLGDPAVLAAGYAGRPLTLIGPRLYLAWRRNLGLMLAAGLAVAIVVAVLGRALSGAAPGSLVGAAIGAIVTVGPQIAFWVTAAFVVLDRVGPRDALPGWTPDRLPPVRSPRSGLGDLLATAVAVAIGIGAVVWDRAVGFAPVGGSWHPALTPSAGIVTTIVLVLVAQLVAPAIAVARGGSSTTVAAISAAIGVASGALVVILLVTRGVLDPRLQDRLAASGADPAFGGIAVAVVVLLTAWGVVDAVRKARRAR